MKNFDDIWEKYIRENKHRFGNDRELTDQEIVEVYTAVSRLISKENSKIEDKTSKNS